MAVLVILQRDLRLHDNPALFHAVETGQQVVLAYWQEEKLGEANKWWLYKSLKKLKTQLSEYAIPLLYLNKNLADELKKLYEYIKFSNIYSNGLDRELPEDFVKLHKIFYKNLLFEQAVEGREFKIFSPFWRSACKSYLPQTPLPVPEFQNSNKVDTNLQDLEKIPELTGYNWWNKLEDFWQVGEDAALAKLEKFKSATFKKYKDRRNIPGENYTSMLSPHLRFGEISVRQIWYYLQNALGFDAPVSNRFMMELGWREFAQHLLYHHPDMQSAPLNLKYKDFKPAVDTELLDSWQKGQTGYPIVDAGMRQLWQSGWMHNRVRMVTASFLVKNLLIPWQKGEEWFFNCLVDADIAANSTNWQWVAGCGTDSAPYFRIFNSVLQSKTYDPQGVYIKRWLPELKNLSAKTIHTPHITSEGLFKEKYPGPIVDLAKTRDKALKLYRAHLAAVYSQKI